MTAKHHTAVIVGVGRTMAEIERSVVEQARDLCGDEWEVKDISMGPVSADDADDMHTENGVRRIVTVWQATAQVFLTSGD